MTKENYETLKEKKAYEALWIDLLNASGFAGVTKEGKIVDRRYYPEATPIKENSMFGAVKPKNI